MCEGSKEGELPLASDAQPPEPFCSQAICWLSRSLGAKSAVSPPCQGPSKTLLHFYLMPATTTKLCPRYQPFPKVLLFSPAFHGGKSQTLFPSTQGERESFACNGIDASGLLLQLSPFSSSVAKRNRGRTSFVFRPKVFVDK